MKKQIITAILFCLLLSGTTVFAENNSKGIAVVDVQQVVLNSAKVKKLETERVKQDKILQESIAKYKKIIDAETDENKKIELQNKFNKELGQKIAEQKKEVIVKTSAIEKEILEAIEKEAKNQGYEMVIQKGSVLYGGNDITNLIIDKVK